MPRQAVNKPRLIIAGPGAGKTYNMVEIIKQALAQLQPYRFLAAITYTNAAAHSIEQRLGDQGLMRKNVFVGTTHSFVNRFILLPFASLFEGIPVDRVFGAVNVRDHPKVLAQTEPAKRNIIASQITASLLKKGVVPYDSMLSLAQKVVKRQECREAISRRLQYLFVDEFQDADTRQYEIFDELRKAGNTAFLAVGDPEQYITSFSYGLRGQSAPAYNKIPFHRLKEKAEVERLEVNRRSSLNLVSFLNQFRGDIVQTSAKPIREGERVFYVEGTNLPTLVRAFRLGTECEGASPSRLYLGFKNGLFEAVASDLALMPVSSEAGQPYVLMREALEVVFLAAGLSERQMISAFGVSRLDLRKVGLETVLMTRDPAKSVGDLWTLLQERFSLKRSESRAKAVEDAFARLAVPSVGSATGNERYATIHKAKGLEADAVLVVAETNNELSKWLATEATVRSEDRLDKCRLGYVAFSRAREHLGLACLQPVNGPNRILLSNLGVHGL